MAETPASQDPQRESSSDRSPGGLRGATPGATQQLPFWGAAAGWDQPEYYETFQAGHRRNGHTYPPSLTQNSVFFNDGRDALLIRGPGGLLTNRFDPVAGQWIAVPGAPLLSDAAGWNQPKYYTTILSADIDGDQQAELLARDANGIAVWKYDNTAKQWNQLPAGPALSNVAGWGVPQYYGTLQCADVAGVNRAELIGRGGDALYVWDYDPNAQTWSQIAALPDLSDANGWDQPQYYSTILTVAGMGDYGATVIFGRGPNGIRGWQYSTDSGNFVALPDGPAWSDAAGWDQPKYYTTIQIGWLGGQGNPALLGRGPNGLEAWEYSNNSWFQLPANQILLDADGWDQPEYYATIQFADLDDDGATELIARGPQGLHAWKYSMPNGGTGGWNPLPDGPAWSDVSGWNQVQYYSTIQACYPLEPGDPGYSGAEGGRGQAVVLASGSRFAETWTYNPTTQTWGQTSNRGFPAFTTAQQVAYDYLTSYWNVLGTKGGGVRYRYNDETDVLSQWLFDLKGNLVPPPSNVSADDWNAVRTQLLNELTWVVNVQNWYGDLVYNQILGQFLGEQLTLNTVGQYLSYSQTDNTQLTLSILEIVAGALAAALGFPGLELGALASIVGVISYAFSAAEDALPGQGGSYQTQYDQLESQLLSSFTEAQTGLGRNLFGITGGLTGNGYVAGDYGLLSAIGQMIETTVWNWPDDSTELLAEMQRGYATEVWKVLFNAYQTFGNPWYSVIDLSEGVPNDYGSKYATWTGPYKTPGGTFVLPHWLGQQTNSLHPAAAPAPALTHQFNPPVPGQVFPLGVPAAEFFQGENGWPTLTVWFVPISIAPQVDSLTPPVDPPPSLPSLDVDLHTSVNLSRNNDDTIEVGVAITNRGLTGASNVEVTEARLDVHMPQSGLPTKRIHLKPGKKTIQTVTFPDLPGDSRSILSVSGRYLGGSFGGSFRITLP